MRDWLALQDGPADSLHGLFKIRPNERREFGAAWRPVERKAPSSVRDGLKVGGGEVLEAVRERRDTGVCAESHAIRVFPEETLATLTPRQADFNLLLKPCGRIALAEFGVTLLY